MEYLKLTPRAPSLDALLASPEHTNVSRFTILREASSRAISLDAMRV